MGRADAFSQMEIDYIRAVYAQLGPTAVAERLGRSKRAVVARAKQMGLTGKGCGKTGPDKPEPPAEDGAQDTLGRLVEARETLRLALTTAPPNAVAGICREYRAVLDEIDGMEGGGDERQNAFASLAASIGVRPEAQGRA